MKNKAETNYERIYDQVRSVPKGRVATYGQIASLAGMYGQSRLVGYALNALKDGSDVPWHRVINSRGRVSTRSDLHWERLQRVLLEAEGVVFSRGGKIPLDEFLWDPEE
jgi:methylated-DNA-protein-cysteine methyltransferase-like protein